MSSIWLPKKYVWFYITTGLYALGRSILTVSNLWHTSFAGNSLWWASAFLYPLFGALLGLYCLACANYHVRHPYITKSGTTLSVAWIPFQNPKVYDLSLLMGWERRSANILKVKIGSAELRIVADENVVDRFISDLEIIQVSKQMSLIKKPVFRSESKALRTFSIFSMAGVFGGLTLLFHDSRNESTSTKIGLFCFSIGLILQAGGGLMLYRRMPSSVYVILGAQIFCFILPNLITEHFLSPAWLLLAPLEIWLFFYRPKTHRWFGLNSPTSKRV